MKIKIALFGLLFANSITHPIYADPDRYLEEDEIEEEDRQSAKKPYTLESEENSEAVKEDDKVNPSKLATKLEISPSIVYQDGEYSTKNGPKMGLQFKANVPKAWCNKDAIMEVSVSSSGKDFAVKKAAVIIGNMVTIGHTSSIFGYAKADPDVLISPGGTVLQFKFERTFDWFQFGCALESPLPMQLGLFDKTQERGEKENGPNRLDKSNKYFKLKSTYPALGLNLGIVGDDFNIALSGLGRFTDYKRTGGASDKETPHCITFGGHLGLHYQIVPKQFTITLQGALVHGLGDYLSGLAPIQSDKERQEMCAVYYLKHSKKLSYMDVYGFGGTLQYCATPKWTFSLRGSYLTFMENEDKPGCAFSDQWKVVPRVAYKVNKHFTISGGYGLAQERRIDERHNKGYKNELSGKLQFSL